MFRKEQSLGLRIWHWGNVFIFALLFLTVILRKTFLSIKANQALILTKAQEMEVLLSPEQAINLARAIRNQMWQWHPWIGFAAIIFLLIRLVIFLLNKSKSTSTETKPLYYKLVKKSHILFYILFTVMGMTGVLLCWDYFFGLTERMAHLLKEIHESLECLMISDFYKQFYNSGSQPSLYFWRDKNGYVEIDCLVDLGIKLVPIEIKSGETVRSDFFDGLKNWDEISGVDASGNYLVYGGELTQTRKDGNLVSWQDAGNLIKKI